jgi:gliding motility-associated protein GldC
MKQTLRFEVELDENNLPLNIKMHSSDGAANENNIKALMVSAWAAKTKETLRIDLWTKDMQVNEMFIMYHQTMIGMANTLEKATGHDKLAGALKDYCEFFAEQTKIKRT